MSDPISAEGPPKPDQGTAAQDRRGRPRSGTEPEVSTRAVKDVTDYIERMMAADFTLQKPLLEIAKDLGYSHALVHRAYQYLEQRGTIEIDRSRQPHLVHYKGVVNRTRSDAEVLSVQLLAEADDLIRRLRHHIMTLTEDNRALREVVQDWVNLAPRITDEVYLPNSKELLLRFRLDGPPTKSFLP